VHDALITTSIEFCTGDIVRAPGTVGGLVHVRPLLGCGPTRVGARPRVNKAADRSARGHDLPGYGPRPVPPVVSDVRDDGLKDLDRTVFRQTATVSGTGSLYFSRWAAGYAIPSMILGGDYQILWSNPSADAMLAAAKDFHLTNGVVACADKAQSQAFHAFLTELGDGPEAWIYCRDEAAQQMVRAEPVRPDGLPPAVALMIYPVDDVDRYLWADFDKVFGLTRAETVVVKRIVSGKSADEIAEELSVALDTIRTHVRRIYVKLGVNNREQLFSKVSVFRVR